MMQPAYYRAWRAAHPEYRDRQRVLRNERRRRFGREDRSAEYALRNRPSVAAPEPILTLHHGHELFDTARAVVGPERSTLVVLSNPLHEDLLSEAVVALLEGRDPFAAVRAYRATEWSWGRHIVPLLSEAWA